MTDADTGALADTLIRLRHLAASGQIRITQHAQQRMVEEDIALEEVLETIMTGEIIEHYPQHRRGACCLLGGTTKAQRAVHVVCTTARPVLIVVTACEPALPKWVTPTERRRGV